MSRRCGQAAVIKNNGYELLKRADRRKIERALQEEEQRADAAFRQYQDEYGS